jgi:hypothetical protein
VSVTDDPGVKSLHPITKSVPAAVIGVSLAISGILLALAQYMSATGEHSAPYYVAWAGYGFGVIPLVWYAVLPNTSTRARTVLITVLSFWSVIPKWDRTGVRPLFFDEFQHYRLLENIANFGHPVLSLNILAIGGSFPGMEYFTYAVSVVTSLGLFSTSFGVAVFAHAAETIGVYALVSELTKSSRAAVIGMMVFFFNPSFLFFDTQYAYETLSLSFVIWGFLIALRAIELRADQDANTHLRQRRTWAYVGASILLSTATVLTHHVSAGFNVFMLLLLAVVVTVRSSTGTNRTESVPVVWLLTVVAAVETTVRYVQLHTILATYLSPVLAFGSQLSQVLHFLGFGGGSTERSPFNGSTVPKFEILCAYAMVPVLLVAFFGGLLQLRRHWRTVPSFLYVSFALGLGFFLSIPLTTSRNLTESAHRSWAYSFIGLAIIIAAGYARYFEQGFQFREKVYRVQKTLRHQFAVAGVSLLCGAVVAVGGVTTGTSADYRFAAPAAAGLDANEISTQTSMITNWLIQNHYENEGLIIDRYVSHQVEVLPHAYIVRNILIFPFVWFRNPDYFSLGPLIAANSRILVIDKRMATVVPSLGFWYQRTEPNAYKNIVVPEYYVYRFNCFNWLNAVFVTKDFTLYEMNVPEMKFDVKHHTVGLVPACMALSPGKAPT